MATNNAINNMIAGVGVQVTDYTASLLIANKGDLLVGNGTNSATTLPVGTDTYVLVADSTQPTGIRYNSSEPAVIQPARSFGYGNSLTNYTMPLSVASLSVGTATLTANTLYCLPFNITLSTTFSLIGMKINTTSATSIRLGIYDATGTGGYPGSLVLDAGTISGVTTGEITISISQLLYGNYWMVFISNGAARPDLGSGTVNAAENVVGISSPNNTTIISYLSEASVGSYFTALPASLASDTFTYNQNVNIPYIFLKV